LSKIKEILKIKFIRKTIHGFWGTGLDRLFMALLPFLAVKLFNASVYGEYTYYFAIATMISMFVKLGLDNGILFFVPRSRDKYISGIFSLVILSASTFGIIFTIINKNFVLYLPLLILLSIHTLFLSIHRVRGKIKSYFLINSFIGQGTTALLLFFLSRIGLRNGILISFTAGYIAADIIFIIYNRKYFHRPKIKKEIIIYSLPLMFASMMTTAIHEIDIIMIKHYLDNASVGIYNIASKIATFPAYLLVIFNISFAPLISRYYHDQKIEELKKIYTQSTRILMIFSFVIILAILLLREYLLGFFGEEFLFAKDVILYRSIGQLVNSSVGSVWYMLSMTGRQKLNMFGMMGAAIINIILNLALIPNIGINGAAIASMITISLINILGYLLVKKYFHVKIFGIF
jgi:O-antigen/teichoic acid export membrane protein